MKVEVVFSQWSTDALPQPLGGGVHELKLTKRLAAAVAAAEDAGSVRVVSASRDERAMLKGHVQSQADSEKAYAAAVDAGRWHHGNLLQAAMERQQRLDHDARLRRSGHDPLLTAVERDQLTAEVKETSKALAAIEVPK